MKPALKAFLISIAFVSSGSAQTPDPDPALNNPDKVSWELFALVNKSVPSIKPRLSRLHENTIADDGNGLLPSEIARLYALTAASRGAGQRIAIVEPAGGYEPDDIAKACAAMKIPVPQIVDIDVGSGGNNPGINAKADAEVALDIQVVAGVAPEARIIVHFTELSEPGRLPASAGRCTVRNVRI
jgi:subtilase family serine protease